MSKQIQMFTLVQEDCRNAFVPREQSRLRILQEEGWSLLSHSTIAVSGSMQVAHYFLMERDTSSDEPEKPSGLATTKELNEQLRDSYRASQMPHDPDDSFGPAYDDPNPF
jgi:hypothetical protein